MSFKIVLLVCAQAILQGIAAQYIGAPCAGSWGAPYAAAEWEYAPVASISASNGAGVAVSTASPLIPAGVSVLSENAYEGTLAVEGALPFLGTVAFEGVLPSAGTGVVAYSCGNGVVGITSEDSAARPFGYGPRIGAIDAAYAAPTAANPWGAYAAADQAYFPAASLAASNGPGLAVSSVSSLIPSGVSVMSENAYEGSLAVGGTVPFLGTVAVEGTLPNAGAGAVAYNCGSGTVGITSEDIGAVAAPFSTARSGWGCGAV